MAVKTAKKADTAKTTKTKVSKKTSAAPKKPVAEATKKNKTTVKPGSGVDVRKLLEAGAHFGHKTSRWHPKMAPYIHSKREGIHIIDLIKTAQCLEEAAGFLADTAKAGKQVLFVGTKRQAYDIVKNAATEAGMPYVVERWMGGMLTNQNTIGGRVKHLKDLESKMENGQLESKYNKLEVQRFQEEIDSMNMLYGGIKNMAAKPGAVFVVDILDESNAVREAHKLNIPVVGIVDTNADPSQVDYPIPANDDAIKTLALITEYLKNAVMKGKSEHTKKADKASEKDEA